MTLTSISFLCFFAFSLLIYYMLPAKFQWIVLLVFSFCFFLLSSTPYTLLYLTASIISAALCTREIGKAKAEENTRRAKQFLILGLCVNIGILAVLKYSNFFSRNVNAVLSLVQIPWKLSRFNFAVPIGISFYTLSTVGYLLDCYWGISSPQDSLLKTALFVGYYPQLTSGPITRYRQMEGQLYAGHAFDYRTVVFGLQRILWGFFLKLVVSWRLGTIVDTIYGNPQRYPGIYIWLAAVLFMFQLFTDFSGCMDIIIGVSECYGIMLPENFRTPFFSRSVQEFWQRWHITLGAWLKDYILYTILRSGTWRKLTKWMKEHFGKKAARQIPAYLGMLGVWLLIGLWHGGAWKYIVGMGVWFWAMIVLAQVFDRPLKAVVKVLKINTECAAWHCFQSVRVLILTSIGNVFFRASSFSAALRVMKLGVSRWNPQILWNGSLGSLGLGTLDMAIAVYGMALLFTVSVLQEKGSAREWLSGKNIVFRWCVWIVLIFSLLLFSPGPEIDMEGFMYAQF